MATNEGVAELDRLSEAEFRARVRNFIETRYPAELRDPPKRLHFRDSRRWYMTLAEAGWLAPGWPREWGGMELSAARQLIMIEEFERWGCARCNDMGVTMIGPLLIRFGTEKQKRFFLPKILSGEHIWCQGYSEPNAGSDLASLRTEAVLDGEQWVVNGQKTWTTLANDANWIFLLVRTDKAAAKQAGISFLLVAMDTPGVTVRPIVNLDRHDEFCEVFFDAVRVPRENLVGEANRGWTMAKALLGFERLKLGQPAQAAGALSRLRLLALRMGAACDPVFRDRYTQLRLDLADHNALYEEFAERVRRGEALAADVSLLKVHQSELFQRITEAMLEVAGENAGLLDPMEGNRALNPAGLFIQARPTSIYGGSNEIQRTIIAKSVLDLPE